MFDVLQAIGTAGKFFTLGMIELACFIGVCGFFSAWRSPSPECKLNKQQLKRNFLISLVPLTISTAIFAYVLL